LEPDASDPARVRRRHVARRPGVGRRRAVDEAVAGVAAAAHVAHDDDPRVAAAYKAFRDSGKYKSVLTSPGPTREHYALTNGKEFFAEMTESYLAVNDFYPFVAGELKQAEPELFALMAEIWGPLPGRGPKPTAK
jgi:hypothetical protein